MKIKEINEILRSHCQDCENFNCCGMWQSYVLDCVDEHECNPLEAESEELEASNYLVEAYAKNLKTLCFTFCNAWL